MRSNLNRPIAEWLWSRANCSDSAACWVWTGSTGKDGYGRLRIGGKNKLAHRAAYEATFGPVPNSLQLDHLCRVRGCINPAHMEPVRQAVNILRGVGPAAIHARQTHCKRGHEFNATNTYLFGPDKTYRQCRPCQRVNLADKKRHHG